MFRNSALQWRGSLKSEDPSRSIFNGVLSFFKWNSWDFVGKHHILEQIKSYPSLLFVIKGERPGQRLCLKMWQKCNDGVYDTMDVEKRTRYLLTGLYFNRCFAEGVYLGIAQISHFTKRTICIERFIERPDWQDVSLQEEYAIVMQYLPEEWRLDQLLKRGKLKEEDFGFLAQEIVSMHKRLDQSSGAEMGTIETIRAKLEANIALFDPIFLKLKNSAYESPCQRIADILRNALSWYEVRFEARRMGGHIKHCHGDLKTNNLWVRPASKEGPRRLLTLDCIDFDHPEFYHIDTLSDVAMLYVGMEAGLMTLRLDPEIVQVRLRSFLKTYLHKAGEEVEQVMPLLTYYAVEKAIVCAYTGLIYDYLPQELIENYLKLANDYAARLHDLVQKDQSSSKVAVQP
jgi:aminoglycoside phosphotransferase family enzyme